MPSKSESTLSEKVISGVGISGSFSVQEKNTVETTAIIDIYRKTFMSIQKLKNVANTDIDIDIAANKRTSCRNNNVFNLRHQPGINSKAAI